MIPANFPNFAVRATNAVRNRLHAVDRRQERPRALLAQKK